MKLRSFAAENMGGTEFVSVCEKHEANLTEGKWSQHSISEFHHGDCDLCEMLEEGLFHARLNQLIHADLIKEGE